MKDTRKKMLDRIRAMLNTEGRTEAEMIAFLAKARELMATYEISESDLEKEAEKVTIHRTSFNDPYEIKVRFSIAIGRFTRCVGFGGRTNPISFAGMESDVIFATWLLDTLQRFVMRALREFQKQRSLKKMTNSNYTSTSFVVGCCNRIVEKLNELAPPVKENALVTAELARNGIVLRRSSSKRELHLESAMKGHKAGDSARFDKPVEAGGRRMLK